MTGNELSAAAITYESRVKNILVLGCMGALGGFVVLLSCWRLLRTFLTQIHESLDVILLLPLVMAPFPVAAALMWLAGLRAAKTAGVNCPNCAQPVISKWHYVLETRLCPYCGVIVISED